MGGCWRRWGSRPTRSCSRETQAAVTWPSPPQRRWAHLVVSWASTFQPTGEREGRCGARSALCAHTPSPAPLASPAHHRCPPCRAFTPQLAATYKTLKAAGQQFEVVFVSCDRSPGEFGEYVKSQPWLAVPFESSGLRAALQRKFAVAGGCALHGMTVPHPPPMTCPPHPRRLRAPQHARLLRSPPPPPFKNNTSQASPR